MLPPQTFIGQGTRLTLEEFATEFRRAWSQLRTRFLKLECWQAYQELPDNRSQAAYQRGDLERAVEFLRDEAEGDRPLYDDIRQNRLDYARVRLVQEPLSDYLNYEMMNYRVRAEMGEKIVVVTIDQDVTLPNDEFFDFLLFDRHTALIHDYGTGDVAHQTGGWIVRDRDALTALEHTVLPLRERSTAVQHYWTGGTERSPS